MPTAELAIEADNDGRVKLNPLGRLSTSVSATADVGLRTFVASLVAATIAPVALRSNLFEEQYEALEYYIEAGKRTADENFPAPKGSPDVRVHRVLPSFMGGARQGRVELVRFNSRFEGWHPDHQGLSQGANSQMWVQHWRHQEGPRPTLLVCHGFVGSGFGFNSAFFSLPWFYRQGYDVALLTLPHHGRRREAGSLYSGSGMFSGGVLGMAEFVAQANHDIRSFVNYLVDELEVPQVAMTGLSLGGFTTSMMAATDERLVAAVPNCAVIDFTSLLDSWTPMSQLMELGLRRGDVNRETLEAGFRCITALNYPAKVKKEGLFVIGGLGDRLAPPEQSRAIWEHWDKPRLHWFPGNHILHLDRASYLRRMKRHFRDVGFAP